MVWKIHPLLPLEDKYSDSAMFRKSLRIDRTTYKFMHINEYHFAEIKRIILCKYSFLRILVLS